MNNSLPENNNKINIRLFILDPLSVIIKLAILSNKSVGSKILIMNNTMKIQEPGPFQAICRLYYNSNKTDLQFIYNPINIACITFLSSTNIQKYPSIVNLFECAQEGLKKLIETYKNCSIITLCLNYYYAIITNHLEQKNNDFMFYKDSMTMLYTSEVITKLNGQWTEEKIKIILELINFLTNDNMANNNVKSLENIIDNIDYNTKSILEDI
jgi:hypothetical protein